MTSVHPLDTPLTRILRNPRLKGVKGKGDRWTAKCPAHEDDRSSLGLSVGREGNALLRCYAGCSFEQIVAALGIDVSETFATSRKTNGAGPYRAERAPHPVLETTYDYVDESGTLLYQVARYRPKDFRPRHPDGKGGWTYGLEGVRRVLYRLPEIIEAAAEQRPIYLVEGEKDADALAELGYAATTSHGGSQSWKEEYCDSLKGASVVILPDNDDPGRSFAEQAAASLTNAGCTVRVVPLPGLPAKGDVSDWLQAGHDLDELAKLVERTRVWSASPTRRLMWRLDEILADEEIMRPPPVVLPFIAFAGRSTLLAAFEKSGKSTLVGAAMSALSLGVPFLGEPCPRGVTVIFGLEEYIGDAARRLRDFGADDTRIYVVDRLPGEPKARLETIRSVIDEVKPSLVVIDSLTAYGTGQVDNNNDSAQMGPLVQAVANLAHETGVAIVIIHHARKEDGSYRGSTAIGGAVDIIVEISAPDEARDSTLRKAKVKGRIPTRGFQYRYDEANRDVLLAHASGHVPVERRIPEFVKANPGCSRNQVVLAMHGKREVTLSAIDFLLKDGQLVDNGSGKESALHVTTQPNRQMWGTRPQQSAPT